MVIVFLATFISWASGAIVLAGVDLVRINPTKWISCNIWKFGIMFTIAFWFLGILWQ